MKWPIPFTLISKLGLLVYKGELLGSDVEPNSQVSDLVERTKQLPNRFSDTTHVTFVDGTYQIDLHGKRVNRAAFSVFELFEISGRLALLDPKHPEVEGRTFDEIRAVDTSILQELRCRLGFHDVLPFDGGDLLRMYEWDISNLALTIQRTRYPGSIFAEGARMTATLVPIHRYPSESSERRGRRMFALARNHPNFGPEVVINGLF